jgi:farnesyl-diphosphate farnesyltransferase
MSDEGPPVERGRDETTGERTDGAGHERPTTADETGETAVDRTTPDGGPSGRVSPVLGAEVDAFRVGEEPTTTADMEWCYRTVEGVSRTFAVTIDELAEPTARRVCVGYLLCRVADTIEDAAAVPPETQHELLRTYGRALDPDDSTRIWTFRDAVDPWLPPAVERSPHWAVVADAPRVVRSFRALDADARAAIRPHVTDLVDGMADFVDRYAEDGGLRIHTYEELEEYCDYAAGTVGRLVTDLVFPPEAVDDDLRADAQAFALLLQLVNVAKDVAGDYREENNVYLPADWLDEEGVAPDAVAAPESAPAVARVVDRVLDRATDYLDGAQRWLTAMPLRAGNTAAAWAIPYLLAVATIRELRAHPEDVVHEGDVAVDRAEVYTLIDRFDRGATVEDLPAMRERMSRAPLHHG